MANEKLVTEIMYLGVLVNSNTDLCFFVRYSGHTYDVDLDICESKENWKARVFSDYAYHDGNNSRLEDCGVKKLESFRDRLAQILDEHNVAYDKMMFQSVQDNIEKREVV